MKFLELVAVDFQADRARLFARAPFKIFFGHIVSAAVLIYLAWDVLPKGILFAWAFWEILVTPYLLYRLGKQAEGEKADNINLDRWQMQLHALFAIVGVSWGLFASFGLDVSNPAHFSIQMAIAAGASAAAARSLGIFKFSFFFYEIPFTGFLAIRIFMLGGDFVLLGVLVVIFMIMMCALANDTSEELGQYLATKLENLELAERYQAAAQDAQRANESKTQFLAQANHDLRQPIHAIGLLTECLREQKLDSEGREILETIDMSVDNLSRLFKSLLNITALDAGGLKPEPTVFAIDDVLEQIARQALLEAEEKNCSLELVQSSIWVKTDKALLSSILQNLVFNAVKYAPGAKILFGVRVQDGVASVHVLDQGIGVPADQQSEIFNEFVRGNPHGPGRTDGLGLGLSIVARTVRLLELSIDFRSTEGVGTHVKIGGLEIVPPQMPENKAPRALETPGTPKARILIIDDNPQVLFSMKKLLEGWGYGVQLCSPVEEPAPEFDMLLMDYHLNIDETGVTRANSINSGKPTAIISGTIDDEIENAAKASGFWVLHKPVSPVQLRSVLIAMAASQS